MVRLGARGPVEHDVGRGHQLDLHHSRVDGLLARIQRRHPDAFVALLDQVAVLELEAADVHMGLADVGNDHADIADGDLHHRHLLHLDEPRVQVPRAGEQDLLLQSAPAAAIQERLRVLEVLVAGDGRSGNLARLDRLAVQGGHNAHHVRLDPLQVQLRFRHPVLVRGRGGNHREQRPVDAVGAGGQDAELPALLAAVQQELARVLEVVALDHFAQDALGRDRRAVGRHHQRNLALRHDGDGRLDDPVLPAE